MLATASMLGIATPETLMLLNLQPVNLLSFGTEAGPISLAPLNVLIGPNGAGKSNFLEAIALLRAAPRVLPEPIRAGGGVREWLWKHARTSDGRPPTAELEAMIRQPGNSRGTLSVSYGGEGIWEGTGGRAAPIPSQSWPCSIPAWSRPEIRR